MDKVLLVEDDSKLLNIMKEELEENGLDLKTANNVVEAKALLLDYNFNLVISDLILPDGKGSDLSPAIKKMQNPPQLLIITAFGTVDVAVECLKLGADDFLTKPLNLTHFVFRAKKLTEYHKMKYDFNRLQRAIEDKKFHGMIGESLVMQKIFDDINQLARSDGSVLIMGESGTGKELVAQAIHNNSNRKEGPFIAVNCASISEQLIESELFGHKKGAFTGAEDNKKGLFAEANGGTLFLDEISEMPLGLQASLLRVLQEGKIRRVGDSVEQEVDVRIVAATNRNLEEEIKNKNFREDLYYRLEAFSLYLPPLRDRRDDIEILINHFFKESLRKLDYKGPQKISNEALQALSKYSFPGNIRELKNIVERITTMCRNDIVEVKDLPNKILTATKQESAISEKTSSDLESFVIDGTNLYTLDEVERMYIHYVLAKLDNNKRRAAAVLGIARRTIYRRIGGSDEASS